MLYVACHKSIYLLSVNSKFLEYEIGNVAAFLQYTLEEVYRLNALLSALLGSIDGSLHGLLCLNRKFVECHILLLSYIMVFFVYVDVKPTSTHPFPTKSMPTEKNATK